MKNQQPKHTPGPWAVKEYTHAINGEQYYSVTTEALGVGDVIPNGITNNKANARLIAVAPEMLEALELCVQALKDHCQYGDADDLENIAHDTAEQVLYKAKGE